MFLRSTRLPSEMLYISLYIDSTQGGWGWGMGNKSDKVAPSLCLSLSHFHSLCPCWLRLPSTRSVYLLFAVLPLLNLLFSSVCIILFYLRPILRSMLGGLRNSRPDVLVLDLWLGSVLTQSNVAILDFFFKHLFIWSDRHHLFSSWGFEPLTLMHKVSHYY